MHTFASSALLGTRYVSSSRSLSRLFHFFLSKVPFASLNTNTMATRSLSTLPPPPPPNNLLGGTSAVGIQSDSEEDAFSGSDHSDDASDFTSLPGFVPTVLRPSPKPLANPVQGDIPADSDSDTDPRRASILSHVARQLENLDDSAVDGIDPVPNLAGIGVHSDSEEDDDDNDESGRGTKAPSVSIVHTYPWKDVKERLKEAYINIAADPTHEAAFLTEAYAQIDANAENQESIWAHAELYLAFHFYYVVPRRACRRKDVGKDGKTAHWRNAGKTWSDHYNNANTVLRRGSKGGGDWKGTATGEVATMWEWILEMDRSEPGGFYKTFLNLTAPPKDGQILPYNLAAYNEATDEGATKEEIWEVANSRVVEFNRQYAQNFPSMNHSMSDSDPAFDSDSSNGSPPPSMKKRTPRRRH